MIAENASEVARLRQQLELECQAMLRGLHGYAITAQHQIIDQKYQAFGTYQQVLETLVGKDEAISIAVEIYSKIVG